MALDTFADLRWYDQVDSTNHTARELVAEVLAGGGPPPHLAVGADHQRQGRGRRARRWLAPPRSSMLLTAAWPSSWSPDRTPLGTLAMALAAAQAVEELAGVNAMLKWPNDLVVVPRPGDTAKLAGVLGERVGDTLITGVGVNLAWPGPLPVGAVDVIGAGGPHVDPRNLARATLARLGSWVGADPEELVEAARRRSATLGQLVEVSLDDGRVITGKAADLSPHGHLVVDDGVEEQLVTTGEVVHLRPA